MKATSLRHRTALILLGVVALVIPLAGGGGVAAQTAPVETPAAGPAAAPAAAPVAESVTVDGNATGRQYGGIGGVSAGASSRLLYDYPEPERSQILDYLFKPGYGASMQILKIEIGSETNSTDGSEPSHERERGQVNCNRGYEWWLAKEAVKRNPDIRLAGLAWGAPGWMAGADNRAKFFSRDNIDYHLRWLDCAEQHGLGIDYMGGWNERGYDAAWFVEFKQALAQKHPGVQLIGADDCCRTNLWQIAQDMTTDAQLRAAVDVVGVHFACGHRTEYKQCSSPQYARDLGKPLWMSENSALSHDAGAQPIARALNRMYTDARMSGYMAWSPVSAWYGNLPIADTGTILAEWPWSGYYEVGKSVWSFAHTAQFTEVGWNYLDVGSGRLASGGSYVSLTAPDKSEFSTVVETLDATAPTELSVRLTGGLPDGTLQVWSTDMRSDDPAKHFVHAGGVQPANGAFTFTAQPGHVYTFTSTTGQGKGSAAPDASVREQMPVPYSEDFEDVANGALAPYYSDLNGSYETAPCGAGRAGKCYRQQTTRQPVKWTDAGDMHPTTVVGDPRWWGDYEVSADVMLEQPGFAEIGGRVSTNVVNTWRLGGYHLRFNSAGGWQLRSVDEYAGTQTLASGSQSIGTGQWHRIGLRMNGSTLTVLLDGRQVGRITDTRQRAGNITLRSSGWHHAQFDDVTVTKTRAWPAFVPQERISATATSQHGFDRGYTYEAANAVDGRPESFWHSKYNPREPLPQSITLDLGGAHRVTGVAVQPRYERPSNAMITRYHVYVSGDGRNFRRVATGSWPVSLSTKTATWSGADDVRFVRLEATEGVESLASVGELNVMTDGPAGPRRD